MNYGMSVSASGTLAALHRMDTLSNNLANADTPGFQADFTLAMQRQAPSAAADAPDLGPNALLARLGGGLFTAPNRVDVRPGPMERTEDPFHIAIEGDGWLRVESETGSVQHTRDGRLLVDAEGRLVHAVSGRPMLDDSGAIITMDPNTTPVIRVDGSILENGLPVAKLGLDLLPAEGIRKMGGGLVRLVDGQTRPATSRIHQGMLEGSSVNPIRAMTDLIETNRAAQANLELLRMHDKTLDLAWNTLARPV
ncbi:MAG: hypothetical protein CMJ28_08135 [Phycisphaerae bacterium]|nr:hypothetical protein [Phycisphaerae bacterium]